MKHLSERLTDNLAVTTAPLELSMVMPCLNEAETLGICIDKAQRSLTQLGIEGEIVVSDNGSIDGSDTSPCRCGLASFVQMPEGMAVR